MKPLISVVIPVFNRSWQLERALESLKQQTFVNFEVLICDDGSTQDIESVSKRFENFLNIRYFKSNNFGGPARSRNIGINNAIGEWVSFLDSDDWWLPERFEILLKYFTENIDFVYHPLKVILSKNLKRRGANRNLVGTAFKYEPLKHMALLGNPVPNSSVVVRRTALLAIGGISEDIELIYVEDFDAWIKLAKHKYSMVFEPNFLGYYWVGNDGISSISEKQILNYKKLFNIHVEDFNSDYLQDAIACNHYYLGSMIFKLGSNFELAKNELFAAKELPFLKLRLMRLLMLMLLYIQIFRINVINYLNEIH